MRTHSLTTEQLQKLVDAIGDGADFPKHTDDPKVNYAVDCIVSGDDDVPEYDEQLYKDEIKAFTASAS